MGVGFLKAVIVTNQVRRYLAGFSTMIEPLKDLGFEVIWAELQEPG